MEHRILFIDDEPEYVRPQITVLQESGFEVTQATDPDEAMQFLQEGKFDLIVMDLIMPYSIAVSDYNEDNDELLIESGVVLHRQIRIELGLKAVPIVFLSVVRDPEILRDLRQLEAECGQPAPSFLGKPISSADVLAEVQRVLKRMRYAPVGPEKRRVGQKPACAAPDNP